MKAILFAQLDKQLVAEWGQLWDQSPHANYANGPQWFTAALETFKYKNFVIVALYKNDQLVAVCPLVKEKRFGISVYGTIAKDFVCGITFLVSNLTDKQVVKELITQLAKLGVVLDNIPEETTILFKKYDSQITYSRQSWNAVIPLIQGKDGGIELRKKHALLKRANKIADKLTFTSYAGLNSQIFKEVLLIDKNSKRRQKGISAFSNKATRNFYKSLGQNLQKQLFVNIMYYDKQPIVYEIGFLVNGVYYGSQLASRKSFDKYSILRVFLIHLFEYLLKQNVTTLDFGSGDNHVKRTFTKEFQPLNTIFISRKQLTNKYLQTIYNTRNRVFSAVEGHKIYSIYRNLKNLKG